MIIVYDLFKIEMNLDDFYFVNLITTKQVNLYYYNLDIF
jgi:hypothetical protein